MSDQSGGPGWWLASDGKWYPPVPPPPPGASDGPAPSSSDRRHYDASVNKGSINMTTFTAELNRRWGNGWRLAHMIEQKGNTVLVWERRD